MQYTINLPANTPISQGTSGRFFLLMDTGVAASVDIAFRVHSQVVEHIATAKRGLKATLEHGQSFTRIDFLSTIACTVTFIVSDGVVDISQLDGANVNATLVGPHVGTVGDPIYVANLSAPPAATIVDNAGVALGGVSAALILAANANRRAIRFANTGANPYALGTAGLTWAKRTIVINPGDIWLENDGANLAWYGITDVGNAATAQAQEVTT